MRGIVYSDNLIRSSLFFVKSMSKFLRELVTKENRNIKNSNLNVTRRWGYFDLPVCSEKKKAISRQNDESIKLTLWSLGQVTFFPFWTFHTTREQMSSLSWTIEMGSGTNATTRTINEWLR